MAVLLDTLGLFAALSRILTISATRPWDQPPWLVQVFSAFLGLVLLVALLRWIGSGLAGLVRWMSVAVRSIVNGLVALVAWIAFAPLDLSRREDIGLGRKLLWLAAFVLSAGLVLIAYGAVRFSSTGGMPGK